MVALRMVDVVVTGRPDLSDEKVVVTVVLPDWTLVTEVVYFNVTVPVATWEQAYDILGVSQVSISVGGSWCRFSILARAVGKGASENASRFDNMPAEIL